jgi:hypothetical protein
VLRARVMYYFCVNTLLAHPVGREDQIAIIISPSEHEDNIHNESRVARRVHRHGQSIWDIGGYYKQCHNECVLLVFSTTKV